LIEFKIPPFLTCYQANLENTQSESDMDLSRKCRAFQEVVHQVTTDSALVLSFDQSVRKDIIIPLFRLVNMRTGIRSWSFHWSKDSEDNMTLRDPSTRAGLEPAKLFIFKNIAELRFPPTPREILHALGYDVTTGQRIKQRKGDHARNSGINSVEVIQFKQNMDQSVSDLVGDGMSKSVAKKEYNKTLYALLPSHDLPLSQVRQILGINVCQNICTIS